MLCHTATCIAPGFVGARAATLCLRPPGVA